MCATTSSGLTPIITAHQEDFVLLVDTSKPQAPPARLKIASFPSQLCQQVPQLGGAWACFVRHAQVA